MLYIYILCQYIIGIYYVHNIWLILAIAKPVYQSYHDLGIVSVGE